MTMIGKSGRTFLMRGMRLAQVALFYGPVNISFALPDKLLAASCFFREWHSK